jgi:hypothetical protein
MIGGNFAPSCSVPGGGGRGHTGPGSFGELVAFQLGKSGHDSHHGLSHGAAQLTLRTGGDAVAEGPELDAAFRDAAFLEAVQQMASVASEPVQFPHHSFITPAEKVEHRFSLRSVGRGPTDPLVAVDAFASRNFQFSDL